MTEESDDSEPKHIDPRKELEDILKEGEKLGDDIAENGRRQTEAGQELSDLSRTTRYVLTNIPNNLPLYGVEDALENWRLLIDSARGERNIQFRFNFNLVNSTSGSAAVSSI
jgi:hypothetical protein